MTRAREAPVPLARLMAMAFRSMIDELHVRLDAQGWADLRPAFGFVLVNARDRVTTGQDVAELMGMSKQAAAKLLDAMEGQGLVRRTAHPGDRRARRVALTARGREALEVVERIYRDIEAEWARALGRGRLEQVRGDLTTALRALHGGELPAVRPTW